MPDLFRGRVAAPCPGLWPKNAVPFAFVGLLCPAANGDTERMASRIETHIERLVNKRVSERTRQRRLELGLSQQTLGESLGVSYQQISKNERGIDRISAGRLLLLATALDKPISWFFMGWAADDRKSD